MELRNNGLKSLLLNHDKKNGNYEVKEPITVSAIQMMVKKICRDMQIRMDDDKRSNVSIHWLRHTFGTNAVRRGMRLDIIKDFMGHSSISTTERYLHAEDNEKRNAYHQLFG